MEDESRIQYLSQPTFPNGSQASSEQGRPDTITQAQQIAGYLTLTNAFFYLRKEWRDDRADMAVKQLFRSRCVLASEMSLDALAAAQAIVSALGDKYRRAA